MNPTTITMIITVIMAILFLVGKFPFGLVTMTCCVALVVTGVLDIPTAFSGLCNQTIVMVASMFALSAALQKTSLAAKLKSMLGAMSGKKDMALMAMLMVIYFLMVMIMPGIVAMAMILAFLDALPDTGEVTPSRVIMPLLMFNVCWEGAFPVGMGATTDFTTNAYMEGIVSNTAHLFNYGDIFKVRIIPGIIVIAYVMFIWKKFPKKQLDLGKVGTKEIKEGQLPKWKEWIVYIAFIAVILVLVFNSYLGSLMWIFPAIMVCVLGFTKVMNAQELISSVASDTVWMLAGILGVTAALTNTGAADIIGDALLSLISWTDNGFIVILICCAFTSVMTTFLSNSGTRSVLIPLVAAMAVAGDMDPRGIVASITICANYAFCFPTGSTTCALAFAAGEYNPFKIAKYTVPFLIILIVITAACANFFFPPFG